MPALPLGGTSAVSDARQELICASKISDGGIRIAESPLVPRALKISLLVVAMAATLATAGLAFLSFSRKTATFRTAGLTDAFVSLWIGAWLPSWLVAFPVVLVVAPLARRAVSSLVRV